MSHLTNNLPVTPFADMVFVEGPPNLATGFWPVVDEQASSNVVRPALRAEVAVLEARLNEANLNINCQFYCPLFRGERRYGVPGQAREWRFFPLADDPLWQNPGGFPLPDATRAELKHIVQSVPELFTRPYELYVAHLVEMKPGLATTRSTWEELAPAPPQWTVNASAQLGRVAGKAMQLATIPYLGAAMGVAAAAVAMPVVAAATIGAVSSLAMLDPILLLARVAHGRPLISGEMAGFFPLASWVYA